MSVSCTKKTKTDPATLVSKNLVIKFFQIAVSDSKISGIRLEHTDDILEVQKKPQMIFKKTRCIYFVFYISKLFIREYVQKEFVSKSCTRII